MERAVAVEIAPAPRWLGRLFSLGGLLAFGAGLAVLILQAINPAEFALASALPESASTQLEAGSLGATALFNAADAAQADLRILLIAVCGSALATALFGLGILLSQRDQRLMIVRLGNRYATAEIPEGILVRSSTRKAWSKN